MNKGMFLVLVLCVACVGCGTVSTLHQPHSKRKPVLHKYTRAIVMDFRDVSTTNYMPGSQDVNSPAAMAGRAFAAKIVHQLKNEKVFEEVYLNPQEGVEALVISGEIVKADEGDPTLRMLVGFGAGRVHFDANLLIHDNVSKELLGSMVISKSSWLLGGAIAATQNVDNAMDGAAKVIAEEIIKAKM